MEAQIAKAKGEQALGAGRRLVERVREALGASAWGSLAAKALVYVAGFGLLAVVGSGKIGLFVQPSVSRALAAAASAGPAGPSSLPAASAPAVATTGPDAGAGPDTDAGVQGNDAGMADAGAGGGGGLTAEGKVVLNRATEEDLRHLPGIGPTRAKAILALRAKLGRFTRVEDLLRVKGIGRRSLARLRPMVLVD